MTFAWKLRRFPVVIALAMAMAVPLLRGQGDANAIYFRPGGTPANGAITFGLPVQAPPEPPPGQTRALVPPGRIGTPMFGNIPLQKWKASGSLDAFEGPTPSLELDSRLIFALFDSPDELFFDNLQFLNRVRASLEVPSAGIFQVDVLDRWNMARELLTREVPPHLPEIHRLFWQWSSPGGDVSATIGRQRLSGLGNRTLGSVSWLPDLQVFDGVRFDLGQTSGAGRWSFGAFIDQAMATPFFAGPSPDGDPVLLGAWTWKHHGLGQWQTYALQTMETDLPPLLGLAWEQNRPSGWRPVTHRVDIHLRPAGEEEDADMGWHLALHRQQRHLTWHFGAERVDDGSYGRRVSATPGTFRYLPGGPDADALNLFAGFDRRLGPGTLASVTFQHLMDYVTGEPAAEVVEAAWRHQLTPTAAFIAGAGCGIEEISGEAFIRSGFQVNAAF